MKEVAMIIYFGISPAYLSSIKEFQRFDVVVQEKAKVEGNYEPAPKRTVSSLK